MNLIKDKWTKADFNEYVNLLKDNSERDYREFHKGLCKTSKSEILGVRLPLIRKFSKEIAKGNVDSFLSVCDEKYYEVLMSEGLVIAYLKKPISEKTYLIDSFVPKIDNWAVCDSFCSTIKPKENEMSFLFDYLIAFALSDDEYSIRFATVLMMDNFINEKYIDRLFEIFNKTNISYYYTSMAVAWSISFCFASFRDKTLNYLENNSLDKDTLNRAVQKCCDSYRISREDKILLKSMKK